MIIIQARANSKRWPKKYRANIDGVPMLNRVVDQCRQTSIRPIVVATTDAEVLEHCKPRGIPCLHVVCPDNDLIKRYIITMRTMQKERCLRVTADCPYIFPQEMQWIWQRGQGLDFCTNGHPHGRTTPDGVDCEVYSLRLLEWMDKQLEATDDGREHLPLSLYSNVFATEAMSNGFLLGRLDWPVNLSKVKFSMDREEEYEQMKEKGLL